MAQDLKDPYWKSDADSYTIQTGWARAVLALFLQLAGKRDFRSLNSTACPQSGSSTKLPQGCAESRKRTYSGADTH